MTMNDFNNVKINKCRCGKELPDHVKMCPECKAKQFKKRKFINAVAIVLVATGLMLIPDPIPIFDEAGIGVVGVLATAINLLRKQPMIA